MALGFQEIFPFEGFDKRKGYEQVVPLGGIRFVQYRFGLGRPEFRSSNPACAQVRDVSRSTDAGEVRILELTGTGEGVTQIQVSGTGCIPESLKVYVLPKRTVTLGYYFVSDTAHSTKRSTANLNPLADQINSVYRPQTNIEFTSVGVPQTIQVTSDLGAAVSYGEKGVEYDVCAMNEARGEFLKYLIPAAAAGLGDVKLFFVWEMDGFGDDRGNLHGFTSAGKRCCLIRDDIGTVPLWFVAAHEIGHALGVDHVAPLRSFMITVKCRQAPPKDPCEGGHAVGCAHWAELSRYLMMSGNVDSTQYLISPQNAANMNYALFGL